MGDDIKNMFDRLREFAKDSDIKFVTAKDNSAPTIADSAFGEDLPILHVEPIDGAEFLTIKRSKHRRGQSESFNFEFVFDEQVKLRRQAKLDKTNRLDQDMPEVKELPPPKPAED